MREYVELMENQGTEAKQGRFDPQWNTASPAQGEVMAAETLATAAYECGRHGLRCKHHLDALAAPAGRAAATMPLPDLLRACAEQRPDRK